MNQSLEKNDNPLSPAGRFGRLSYLAWTFLSSIVLIFLLAILMAFFGDGFNPEDPTSLSMTSIIVLGLIYIVFIYYSVIFAIRRLHDRNHSGWLVLLLLVPLVNIVLGLYLLFAKGHEGSNQYGPKRQTQAWEKILGWLYIVLTLLGFIAALVVGFTFPSYDSYEESSIEVTTPVDAQQ